MTTFEVLVPIVALVFAGASVLFVRNESKKIDRLLEHERKHPAE